MCVFNVKNLFLVLGIRFLSIYTCVDAQVTTVFYTRKIDVNLVERMRQCLQEREHGLEEVWYYSS
jgi:hypothetical protein